MAYYRNYWPDWSTAPLGWVTITIATFAWITSTLSPLSYAEAFFAPVLPPTIEVAYQAVLADEHVIVIGDATLNDQLRSIDIRTALEDTQRLRYDLG